MKVLLTLLVLITSATAGAQIISRFDWSSSPLTAAAVGPNGTSVSTSAAPAYVGGAIGYAINPGLPTKNIDLIVPGSPTFDIPGIEIDLQFRREETVASFFKRGSMVNFGMNNGYLTVTFTTTQGSTPGNVTINSGNIMTVPDDHQFHRYTFRYDNNTGIARVLYDGNIVYTYNGVAGRPLAYAGVGNVVIGENMDATSRNIPVLANLTVQNIALLPVKLLNFTAHANSTSAVLKWQTTGETDFSHFDVEYAFNGRDFKTLVTVQSARTHTLTRSYEYVDTRKLQGTVWYRLKMVDLDGKFKYSAVVRTENGNAVVASCFPNPAKEHVTIKLGNAENGLFEYTVRTLQGHIVKIGTTAVTANNTQIVITLDAGVPAGLLLITVTDKQQSTSQVFRLMKS